MQMGGEAATITMNFPRTSLVPNPYRSYHDQSASGSSEEKSRNFTNGVGEGSREPESLDAIELQESRQLYSSNSKRAEHLDNHIDYALAGSRISTQKEPATARDGSRSYSIFYDHDEEGGDDVRERIGQDTFCQSKDLGISNSFSPTASSVLDSTTGRSV
jgi:hypothetical protein